MITASTTICGIIGNPVEHSLSPNMHNAAYEALNLNFAWVAFKVENVEEALQGIRALNIRGVAVTIPHKQTVMKYLDEIDETAQKIGAVNTIVNENGKLKGTNTDWKGAMQALEEVTPVEGKNIVVLGAGGAARAILYGLKTKNAKKITLLNRTEKAAQKLAEEFKLQEHGLLNDLEKLKEAEIIINTTPSGMHPNVDEVPIDPTILHKEHIIFDIVFNPKETKLLQAAKQQGCTVIYGYKMLLYQAVHQFKLFTGHDAPVEVMERKLEAQS